jgi:hypothetical protein
MEKSKIVNKLEEEKIEIKSAMKKEIIELKNKIEIIL